MKKEDIVNLSREYCKSYNIPEYDNIIILNQIKETIENYFNKTVYFSKKDIRFIENDRKVSISEKLFKLIKSKLNSFIKEYIESNTKLKDCYELQYSVQICTVFQKTEHGYYVSFLDKKGFIPKNETYTLDLGQKYYFYVEKFNKKKKFFNINVSHKRIAQKIINKILGEEKRYVVNNFKANKIVSFYYFNNKPTKEDIEKIRLYFKKEKIIYNRFQDLGMRNKKATQVAG